MPLRVVGRVSVRSVTTMIYSAKVERIDEDIEEEVTLVIDGLKLVCFAGVCPYPIEEGKAYPVSLHLVVFDDYMITEVNIDESSLKRIGQGFSYIVTGRLSEDTLNAGIAFQDQVFLSDYGYLDGKMVSVKVDRIDAEFLSS
jgi:hypothetical protein